MLVTLGALINAERGPSAPLLYGRRSEEVLRKKLAVLLAAVMMLIMAASPAWAAPGKSGQGNEVSQGIGKGRGGGDLINPDNGDQKAKGGGTLNNPNVSGF